ncbi:MAG: hypothetical protein ACT4SY_14785 [Hyphomicrobiales bacterium]
MVSLASFVGQAVSGVLSGAGPSRIQGRSSIPTTSLYFADPLSDLIGDRIGCAEKPIRRISATAFACGAAAVIVRYAGEQELAFLRRGGFRKIYLLIDDDLQALHDGDGLPADWRRRLLAYRDGALRKLLDVVTHVVAPSEPILQAYRRHERLRLEPAQCHSVATLDHHDRTARLDIVFAATRSHLGDLEYFAPAIAGFLKARPDAHLTTFLYGHAPAALRKLPNVTHHSPMGWESYRAFVAAHRFHIALAPALDTAFNRARSLSRLHDHAGYGAAGLYSAQPPFAGTIANGKSGRLLPTDPAAWQAALFDLADRRNVVRHLAEGGRRLSAALGDQARVRGFWQRQFGLN